MRQLKLRETAPSVRLDLPQPGVPICYDFFRQKSLTKPATGTWLHRSLGGDDARSDIGSTTLGTALRFLAQDGATPGNPGNSQSLEGRPSSLAKPR